MALLIFVSMILGVITLFLFANRWTTGELHGIEVLGALAVTILLILIVLASPVPFAKVIAALLLIISFMFITTESKIHGAIITRQMLNEDLEKYRSAAEYDPSNFAARIKIAKTLYQMGHLESAIEHMKAGLQMAGSLREEQSQLRMWEEELEERLGKGEVFCPKCQTKNRRGVRVCRKCEAYLRSSDEVMDWLRRGGLKTVLRTWLVGVVVATMLVFALSFLSRIGMIVIALLACIAFLFWMLWRIWSRD